MVADTVPRVYQIPRSKVIQAHQLHGRSVPTVTNLVCPYCKVPVAFYSPEWTQGEVLGQKKLVPCPQCQNAVGFIVITDGQNIFRLFVDAEQPVREPLASFEDLTDDEFPEPLRRTYLTALELLSIGKHDAVAITCRSALEGVVGEFRGSQLGRENLAVALRGLAQQHEKLSAPILGLANTIKDGGNFAAHYNSQRETAPEDAEQMVEFLELLINLLFVIPGRVEELAKSIHDDPDEGEPPAESVA